ncbi:MAG: O-antigen ligase family protein [bacterium]
MNFVLLIIPLCIGLVLWILDNIWLLTGNQFIPEFFFAGGLHPGEQYIYIIILAILNIILSVLNYKKLKEFHINLGLLFLFAFVIIASISSFFFSVDKFESLRETFMYMLMFNFCWFAYNYVISVDDKEEFLYNYSLVLITIFVSCIVVALIVNLGLPRGSPWMSLFYQKNAFGGFVLMFIPIAFSLFCFCMIYREYPKAVIFFICFILSIFSLIFSASKASFLSFIISIPLYFGLIKIIKPIEIKNINPRVKTLFYLSTGLSLTLLILQFLIDKKFTSTLISSIKAVTFSLTNTVIARVDFWEASIKIAQDFLFGCGLYNFSKVYPLYQAGFYYYSKDPHNYYLKLLSEVGFLGLLLFICFILYFIYRAVISYSKLSQFSMNFIKSEEYKDRQSLKDFSAQSIQDLSMIGVYLLSVGITIGLMQILVHIAFDVDFKFSYILIIFLTNLVVNLAIIENLEYYINSKHTNQHNIKLENITFKNSKTLWVILSISIGIICTIYGIREAIAYKIDKEVEKTGNYKQYLYVIKNSFPSSSKYVTLAELYRINLDIESCIQANIKAIQLCKYNINAYLSLSYLYDNQVQTLLEIKQNSSTDKSLQNQIKNKIITYSDNIIKICREAMKYDDKNYPDVHLLLASAYEYKSQYKKSINYQKMYKQIFSVIYPPKEYINLMDIRYNTFGDVIAEAYMKYLINDFIKCREDANYCKKVYSILYEPLIVYKIKTTINDLYLIGALSFYIYGKSMHFKNKSEANKSFTNAKKILEEIYTKDFVSLYYYTSCEMYLENYSVALNLARVIYNLSTDSNLSEEDKQKLILVKTNIYSVLANIYLIQNKKNLYQKFIKLYEKYSVK